MTVSVLGIRHHGPGSARAVAGELARLDPEIVLIEGPPDANALIPLAADPAMRPPVALLIHAPDEPGLATFYPFASFSPEWQAMRFALERGLPVRFIDLAVGYLFARRPTIPSPDADDDGRADDDEPATAAGSEGGAEPDAAAEEAEEPLLAAVPDAHDPLGWLARAAGEPDGERWWDRMVESRRSTEGVFEAVVEAMGAVRTELPDEDPETALREATMRQGIRQAQREGHRRIAVVCGAWHAPALVDMPAAARDAELLRSLPKPTKTAAAWVPWTYERLSVESGYGAGIRSPGWYEHLWRGSEPLAVSWMARVAQVFREADLDASSAHLIEAARLAETLAAFRGRATPSLAELDEATRSVLGMGADASLALVRRRLVVGEVLGEIPPDAPTAPLAADLERETRRLRFRPEPGQKVVDLDLRSETGLARSHLLHRLLLLGVRWGTRQQDRGSTGTFHELWSLDWQPELAVALIAASRYGTTIAEAASAKTIEAAREARDLESLTTLVEQALLADLRHAIDAAVGRLGDLAAVAADVGALMDALPPLARVLRYGNVRGTDLEAVGGVVGGLVARIAVGLGPGSVSLDDDAAATMTASISAVHGALGLIDDPDHLALWQAALRKLADQGGVHGLITGRVVRLLLDATVLMADEATRRMRLSLSVGNDPAAGAAWVEGFLADSGMVLLHDPALWRVIDDWLAQMPAEAFDVVLPLLRRTTSTFPAPERRAIAERAKGAREAAVVTSTHDPERAAAVHPILELILGLEPGSLDR